MIDRTSDEYIKAREAALKNARLIRAANAMVKVSGKRMRLPLSGRSVDIVYYGAPLPHAPLIVGYHGGGFMYGGCALDDTLWPVVADALGANIRAEI